MRKKFHIVKLHLEGRIDHPIRNVSPDMDVADEFHRLSYLLGFEAGIDEYSGLWSTEYVYDDFSSLAGDFLRRGLTLVLIHLCIFPLPQFWLACSRLLRRLEYAR